MRRRARWLLLPLCLVTLVVGAPRGRADVDGTEFESATWRVQLSAPRSWQLNERSSYPNILLWMSRRSPRGKMLFSAERLPAGEGAREFAARTAAKLESLGFRVRAPQLHSATGAYWLDVERPGSYLRQAFLAANGIGYSLTLSAETSRARSQHLRAFDATLRSIRLLAAAPPADADAPGEAGEGAGEDDDAAAPPAGAAPEPAR